MQTLTHLFFNTQCSPAWWQLHFCKITGLSNLSLMILAGLAIAGYKFYKARKAN